MEQEYKLLFGLPPFIRFSIFLSKSMIDGDGLVITSTSTKMDPLKIDSQNSENSRKINFNTFISNLKK